MQQETDTWNELHVLPRLVTRCRGGHLFTAPLHTFLLTALPKLVLPLLLFGLTVVIVIFIIIVSKELVAMPAIRPQGNAVGQAVCQLHAVETDRDDILLGGLATPLPRCTVRKKPRLEDTDSVVSFLTVCCTLKITSCKNLLKQSLG